MGIIRASLIPLLKHLRQHPAHGAVLLLGEPQNYLPQQDLLALIARYGLNLCAGEALLRIQACQPDMLPNGRDLFLALGFDKIHVLDASPYEGADIIHDLNRRDLPSQYRGAFAMVIDHGTIEHVFHLPNCLANLFDLLQVGGRLVVCNGANNFMDHGFYQFSPTLFADYFAANQWSVHEHLVMQFTPQQTTEPPFYADYDSKTFTALNYGGLDNKLYGNYLIVEKTAATIADAIPQQGHYQRLRGWAR